MHGARVGGRWCPTKKALREALAADPASVLLEDTSLVTKPRHFRGNEVPEGERIAICGPDPHHRRIWYATVMRKADGTVRVS